MKKPEVLTQTEVFFDYYFTKLIEEQKKTNQLLERLLNEGGKENVISSRTRKSV